MVVRQDEIFMQEFQKCLVFALEEFGKKVDGKVPGADRLLILSLSFPC